MSNKSGVSSQVLSLPKGGGAIHSIGETFSPDLFRGTGNFNVPIMIPSGRNNFQPQLSLVYSTGNGSSPFGLGWNLSVPGISRKTSDGVPRYQGEAHDESDTFILSGAEDLVPLENSSTQTRYRPRTEGLFAQIVHYHDLLVEGNYWEVHSKDGLISRYGMPGPTNIDQATIADPRPNKRNRIFAWKLAHTVDPFGNRIEYQYEHDRSLKLPFQWDQVYLTSIRYIDYRNSAGQVDYLVTIEIEYDKARPDVFSDYRAGFEIRTGWRCERINVYVHDGTKRPIRAYELSYHNDPFNNTSLLDAIQVVGYDDSGTRVEEMPPLTFGYTVFEPEERDFFPLAGCDLPPQSLDNPDYELADLYGSGLPDVLQLNGVARYWRNRGNGLFDPPREMETAPAGLRLADPDVQLIDANGDGRIDLLTSRDGEAGYFSLRPNGLWDKDSFCPYTEIPSFDFEDPEVKLVDLTGDGLTDIVRSGAQFECFFNHKDRHKAWDRTRWVQRLDLDVFPDVNFSDPRVRWADMSGDGLQDIVLLYDGNIEYWPNLGYGDWGHRVSMRNSPHFPNGYNSQHILLGDVDGDGLDDILYVDHDQVMVWINQNGKSWSEKPVIISGTPPVTEMDAVRLVDMLGSGVSGVLWSADKRWDVRHTMHFLDFTGGVKPYLLNEMDNHMGAVTRIQYAASTRDYLADNERYTTKWKTSLPFPVQVVARVDVIDAISRGKLTTEYHYHHGYWDGAEREFRGFGCVDQWDSETFEDGDSVSVTDQTQFSPPTLTRTWFHLGPVGDEFGEWTEYTFANEYWSVDPPAFGRPAAVQAWLGSLPRRDRRDAVRALQGSILRAELYAQDKSQRQSRPYTVTEQSYGIREEEPFDSSDPPRKRVFFPYTVAQRTTQWERGDDPLTTFTFSDDYDSFGQPCVLTTAAMPRRADKRRPVTGAVYGQIDLNEPAILVTHTRTQYATPDPDLHMGDRVAQAYTFELSASPMVNEVNPTDLSQTLIAHRDAAQTVHTQFQAAFANWLDTEPLPNGFRLIGHTIYYYDGAAYVGRPVGEVGPYGAITRTQALAVNDAVLQNLNLAFWPSYLGGNLALPAGAPTGFANNLGYRRVTDASGADRFYVDTLRQQFDFQRSSAPQRRGMIMGMQDALQNESQIDYDAYWLLPIQVTDARQLTTTARFNYRVFQPEQIIDPNGHSTFFLYTPVGLLAKQYLVSRDGEGGSAQDPESEFIYNFWRYEKTRQSPQPQPVFARSRQRIWHETDNQNDDLIEAYEYSDGFGRIIQRRVQAEDLRFGSLGDDVGLPPGACTVPSAAVGQRTQNSVIVSGWQVYDNKGRPVQQYEPFFSQGWNYQGELEAKRGRYAVLHYDPRGQLLRTLLPDGSERRVIYGIPADLTQPDSFEPTPWEMYTYDANDLAPLSSNPAGDTLTARAPNTHHFTPGNHIYNAQGKVLVQIDRNGANATTEWYITHSRYDVRGNLVEMRDSANRLTFHQSFDLLNQAIQTETLDSGSTMTVVNAVGERVDYRDAKGSVVLHEYDSLVRLKRVWARNDSTQPLSLRESITYGDELTNTVTARTNNLLGQPYRHYDEAGLVQFNRYDFKTNLLDKTRWVISDAALAQGWVARWEVPGSDSALDTNRPYPTQIRYDALNRVVELMCPPDVNNIRVKLQPIYNRAGTLQQVDWVEGGTRTPYVSHIAYNAKGQRVLIAYGNGIMTRYSYDPDSFKLIRLRTEQFTPPAPANERWVGTGLPLQDFTYEYDLVGNVTRIVDCTRGSGVINSADGRDRLTRAFRYDALYRLREATGRACRNIGAPRAIDDQPRCGSNPASPNPANAPTVTELYTESYDYDPLGNLLQLNYAAASGTWSRRFSHASQPIGTAWETAVNNRLTSLQQTGATFSYDYDASGNLRAIGTARQLSWNYANQLIRCVDQPSGAAQPSMDARYLYGADGTRVKKWVRKNGSANTDTSTVYIDGVFEHHRWRVGNSVRQNNHIHVMDDERRIALVRRGNAQYPGDNGPRIQYHLGDHLDSSSIVIDGGGSWINREEYFPYGETSFGSFARKRYRFTGKERDEESGLYYHEARYLAPWMARWISCDPEGMVDGPNLYFYAENNPLNSVDPTGTQAHAVATKLAQRGLAWLAKRGKTIAAHPAKKHARTGIRDMLNKAKMGHGPRGAAHSREVGKLLVGNQAKKLVERTLKGFDEFADQGGRMLYQKAFKRVIGHGGETTLRVIIEKATGKLITYFPTQTLRMIMMAGTTAVGLLNSSVSEAAEFGEKRGEEMRRLNDKFDLSELILGSSPIGHEDIEGLQYVQRAADNLIRTLEEEMQATLSAEDREEIRNSVSRAYYNAYRSAYTGEDAWMDEDIEFEEPENVGQEINACGIEQPQ